MDKFYVFVGDIGIFIEDEFFEVKLYFPDTKLKKDIGYIRQGSDIVEVYRGRYSIDNYKEPGLYSKDGKIISIKPKNKKMYSIDNVIELNVGKIFDIISSNEENFIQPEDIEVINNNSEIFVPTIKEDDDFLKYLVKKIIIDKKINLKNYKGRFTNDYALTNMKSGLSRSTKMTVTNFKMWCEILGIKWEMVVYDSGEDKLSPLREPIEVSSDEF